MCILGVGHLGYSIQRGRFEQVAGKIRLDGAAQQGTLDIVVSAASVTTGFAQRDEQLRGVEFLTSPAFRQ